MGCTALGDSVMVPYDLFSWLPSGSVREKDLLVTGPAYVPPTEPTLWFHPIPQSIQQEEASQGLTPPLFSNSDAYTTISNMGQLLTPPAGFCSVPAQLLRLPCCIHSLWGTRPYKLLGGLPGPAKLQQRQHLGSKKGTSVRKGLWGYLQHGPAAFSLASTCSEASS